MLTTSESETGIGEGPIDMDALKEWITRDQELIQYYAQNGDTEMADMLQGEVNRLQALESDVKG